MLPRSLPPLLLALCLAAPASSQEPPNPAPPVVPTPTSPVPDPVGGGEPQSQAAPAPGTQPPPAGATPPAPAPAPAPSGPPGAGPDRIDFVLNFPEDQGGGSAAGSSGNLEYVRENYAVLTGGVQIRYQDIDLKSERAEIDLTTKVVTATGEVILDQGPRRLSGDTLTFDLDTKTGTLTNASAHVAPDYYFSGTEIAKTGENTYTVTDGLFTSCSQEVPDWSFRLGTATVEVEGYAHVRNATMRAKKLPVFYTPYILWPVKSERTSGFLIPNIGYSDRRGASIGLAYFQTLGRSYDTTFHLDTYTESYLGIGNELRYRPTEGTQGNLLGYMIRDPEAELFGEDEWRWKLEWNHTTTDLPWNMRGVVQFQDYSDFNFFRDFERDFDRNTLRFIDSKAFVTGNWGAHLVNLLLNDRQTFTGINDTDSLDQQKLPELEYRLRRTRIGRTPLYMQFDGSAASLALDRPNEYEGEYGRVDLFPQLSLPLRAFPWLSVSIAAGERLTWYSDSLNETRTEFTGESLSRDLPFANAQIVGPSFSRIFDQKIGSFGRFKHVIEPRFVYNYFGDFDEQREVPLFDEIDPLRTANTGRVVLANRLLAKPADGKGSAREVLLFELARSYSFDDERPLQGSLANGTTDGPLEALLRITASARTFVKLEATYNTLFSGLDSTSLSGNLALGRNSYVGLTWFTNYLPQTGETASDQLRLTGAVTVIPQRLQLETQINYDVDSSFLQQQTYVLNWTDQCYGVRLELRDFRSEIGPRFRDKDFRFSLTLKNVGTFLDLTSRSSSEENF